MILSGDEILKNLGTNIVIDPFDETRLNPNSYNLTLHDERLWAEHQAAKPADYDELVELKQSLFEAGRQRRIAEARARLSPPQRAALEIPAEKRSAKEERLAREAELAFQFTPEGIERGIPAEDLNRVFTRLYRADNVLIQGVGDTGVGLSIAKTLTEAQKGRIWVESQMGVGSTFSVLLPLARKSTEN